MKTFKLLGIWVDEDQKTLLTEHAKKNGKSFSKWAGEMLLDLAKSEDNANEYIIKRIVQKQIKKEAIKLAEKIKTQIEEKQKTKVKIIEKNIDNFFLNKE